MAFGKDYWKAVVKETASRLNITTEEVVDKLQDGLMVAHEKVGHVADDVSVRIFDLANAVQDTLMDFSEALEEYAGLAEATSKAQGFGEPGVPVNPFTKFVNRNATNTQEWQSRDEKVTYILNYFGLKDTPEIRDSYKRYDDEQLDAIVAVIRKYDQ